MGSAYRNLGYILLGLPLIIIAGFWIPYFSAIPRFDPSFTTAVHVHALLLFAWVALMVIQPLAVRDKAFAVHRILGKLSYALMPLILLFSAAMLSKEYHENLADGMPRVTAIKTEYLSTTQLAMVAMFYGLAVWRIRKRMVADHMRYMICIALVLLPAGLARTLGYWFHVPLASAQTICFGVIDFCLVSLITFDLSRRLPCKPFAVALVTCVIVEVGWFALGRP